MDHDLSLSTKPTEDHLVDAKNWLCKEFNDFGEGFYSNWELIKKANDEDRFIVFLEKNKVIGFMTWTNGGIFLEIDIFEIHPEFRGIGLGKSFFN